ncbi:choice-of-anchor D domain-containing protein [Thiocystis violacea]|uniref:choice-of-anchor D domain-containing protein n=1 Tax=Thiocystis violacea TaxID=13725 RepID=UPI0019051BFA|nr:choice-of-anchor D domain-containing protein [Thiocystis violacea]
MVPRTETALQSQLSRRHRVLPSCVDARTGRASAAPGCDRWLQWKHAQEAERPKAGSRHPGHPTQRPKPIRFPAPVPEPQSWLDTVKHSALAATGRLLGWAGGREARAAGGVNPILGTLTSWSTDDLLLPPDNPPGLGVQLYGKYDSASQVYHLALQTPSGEAIGPRTTLWLDTDQDATSGYQVSTTLGAEYQIHIYSDGRPYLYRGTTFEYVGPVASYAFSADGSVMELEIPASAIGVTSAQSINLIGVVADVDPDDYPNANPNTSAWLYFPTDWSAGHFLLSGIPVTYPERTDLGKRVAVVFCEASQARFWSADAASQTDVQRKAYSQLYMALQHQAMMAGIPFDLLSIDALKDVANIVDYDALILPYCANVSADDLDVIAQTLSQAVYHYQIGLVTADDLLTNDAAGAPFAGGAYARMAQLLGLTRVTGGGPEASLTVSAAATSHPVMRGYGSGETLLELPGFYWSQYAPLDGQQATALAVQTINGSNTLAAVWATETGGRNVHFSNVELLGNINLAWQALQWVLYGEQIPVGLKMGRGSTLFASRTDMDQSMFRAPAGEPEPADGVVNVDAPLLELLRGWKTDYDFVGSYYINIGDNVDEGEWTDWNYSGPLFIDYVNLGNEIGTHSLTHPEDTNPYDALEHPSGYQPVGGGVPWATWLARQFRDSMDLVVANVMPTTWEETPARGGAVPGMPESLETAAAILQQGGLDYLTGGYSGLGAGFPGAVGYLIPPDAALAEPLPSEAGNRVYFSPTLYFDFTLIEWGLTTGQLPSLPESGTLSSATHTPIPATCSGSYATCAESVWPQQYLDQLNHASQPVVVWPWHDYGPTTSSQCQTQTQPGTHCYSQAMYTNVLAAARGTGAEFVTLMDAAERIETLRDASLIIDAPSASQVAVTALPTRGRSLGKLALQLWPSSGQILSSVDNWYAYGDDKVFLPASGGRFVARLGSSRAPVTHISRLPMRAELRTLSGDGTNLDFSFTGSGVVEVLTQGDAGAYEISLDGASAAPSVCASNASNCLALVFDGFGTHSGSVVAALPAVGVAPTGLSFPSQAVGTTSAAQPVVVTSEGSGRLSVTSVAVEGDFVATSDCSAALPSGSSCTIAIAFQPVSGGVRTGALRIATNDPAQPTLSIPLTGEGLTIPVAAASPASLIFSAQTVGAASAPQGITLSNKGSADLDLAAITATGDFAQTNDCPATLGVGASCGVSVTFTPRVSGSRSGRIEVASSDPVNPVLGVTLDGAGVAPPAAPGSPTVSCSRFLFFIDRCQVRWQDLSSDEQGFRVEYAKNSSYTSGARTLTLGSNSTTTTISGLSWWTNYWFRVQSYNAQGASAYVTATPSPVRTP